MKPAEAAPSTVPELTGEATVSDGELLAPVSAENAENASGIDAEDSTPRLLVRAAQRVEQLANAFGEDMSERRTASEVFDDVRAAASEKATKAGEYGKRCVTAIGRAAVTGIVTVVTAPARGAEKLAEGMESGLNRLEERAKTAESRKMERVVARRSKRSLKAQVKEDMAYAEQVKKEIRAEAKQKARDERDKAALAQETAKQQAKAQRREQRQAEKHKAFIEQQAQRIERAKQAQARKAARRARYQERFDKGKENFSKRARQAKRLGGVVVNTGVDVATGLAVLGAEAGKEAREVGGEIVTKAKEKAVETKKGYHLKRGRAAVKKAERHLNKSTSRPGESYRVVNVRYEDGK